METGGIINIMAADKNDANITCLKLFRQSTTGVSDAGRVGSMSSNVTTTSS